MSKRIALAMLIVIAGFLAYECLKFSTALLSIYRPSEGETMESVARHITIDSAYRVEKGGKTFTVLVAESDPEAFPSGPPVYVFDADSLLVDWTRDSGDSPGFAEKWLSIPKQQVEIESLNLRKPGALPPTSGGVR